MTKRLHTLEEVNNNVKLLSEMLLHYSKEDSAEADKELMKVPPHEDHSWAPVWVPLPSTCPVDAATHLVAPNLLIGTAAS